jgi:hypothetical protein
MNFDRAALALGDFADAIAPGRSVVRREDELHVARLTRCAAATSENQSREEFWIYSILLRARRSGPFAEHMCEAAHWDMAGRRKTTAPQCQRSRRHLCCESVTTWRQRAP